MRNKIKQIYKGFSTSGFDSFFGEGNPGATISHFRFYTRMFLVAGCIHQWASEVGGNEGTGLTRPQIMPLGGPQMGPKSTPFFM